MIEDLRLGIARWISGLGAAPEPSPVPPPTDETRREILRIRQIYQDVEVLIFRRWANIAGYEQGAALLILFILLIFLTTTWVKVSNDFSSTALIVAVFALVIGAGGALIQSLVTHVVSLERAVEDLARQLAVADGSSNDAEALAAVAEADRIINGRLRWAMETAEDALTVGGTREGRPWRWSRIGLGVLLEAAGAAVIGFYVAVAVQGIHDGMLAAVLSACLAPFVLAMVFLLMGHAMRTWDKRFRAARAESVARL